MKVHFVFFTEYSPKVSMRLQRLQSAGETLGLACFSVWDFICKAERK